MFDLANSYVIHPHMESAGDALQYNLHKSVAQSLHSLYYTGSTHY